MAIPKNFALLKIKFAAISFHQLPPNKSIQNNYFPTGWYGMFHIMSNFYINKYSCLLSLTLLIFIIACKDNKPAFEGELKLLTYNVAGLPDALSKSTPSLYTSSISKLINEYDVVHVQEDFCFHDSLILHNTHPHQTDPLPCVPHGDGLNTFSNFPIQNFKRFAWDDCFGTDCLTPKGFSYSQIALAEGLSIDFYNVHCNAGGGEEDLEARRGNIKQLTSYIQTHSQGKACIVMGDFNSRYTREGDTIRAMLDMGFTDLWLTLVRDGNIPTYGTGKLKDCSPKETAYDCEGIDKMFFRNGVGIVFTPLAYKHGDDDRYFYMANDTIPLSDHLPSYCLLKYEPEH